MKDVKKTDRTMGVEDFAPDEGVGLEKYSGVTTREFKRETHNHRPPLLAAPQNTSHTAWTITGYGLLIIISELNTQSLNEITDGMHPRELLAMAQFAEDRLDGLRSEPAENEGTIKDMMYKKILLESRAVEIARGNDLYVPRFEMMMSIDDEDSTDEEVIEAMQVAYDI